MLIEARNSGLYVGLSTSSSPTNTTQHAKQPERHVTSLPPQGQSTQESNSSHAAAFKNKKLLNRGTIQLLWRTDLSVRKCLLALPVVTVFPRPRMAVVFAHLCVTAFFRSGAWSRPHLIANDKLPNGKSSVAGDGCKYRRQSSLSLEPLEVLFSPVEICQRASYFYEIVIWTPKQCHPFYQSGLWLNWVSPIELNKNALLYLHYYIAFSIYNTNAMYVSVYNFKIPPISFYSKL